jgi:glutamate:Na+ symporter, ESS family
MNIILPFCTICVLLAIGKLLRVKVKWFQALYIPSSILSGILALALIQIIIALFNDTGKEIVATYTAGWNKLPGFLINIVFAVIFLGTEVPTVKSAWNKAGPQLVYGQIVAFGQYVVGLTLAIFFLSKIFDISAIFGGLIPVGFEGGHGTAAGLADTFAQYGWPEGKDLALAAATFGIVSAVIVGMILINWAIRKGYVTSIKQLDKMSEFERAGLHVEDTQPTAGRQTVACHSIDSLAFHIAIIGVAILVGLGILEVLKFIEMQIPGMREVAVFQGFPLFPLAMIGGLIVQLMFDKCEKSYLLDHGLMQRVGGTALDFLVVSAIAIISINAITSNFYPFIIIVAGGILWNVFCVMFLAKRLLPNYWFERAIAEMGQSMGVTATGVLLLRAVDPN